MLAKTFIAAGALLSMASAVPMQQNKRDIVWETDVEVKYVTVDVTTTIWLNPGETPPAAASPAGDGSPGHYGHKHHGNRPHSPAETPAAPSAPAPPSPPAETPDSTYVAPTTTAAAQTPSTPYVAPAPTTTEAAAPSSPAAAPSPPSSGGGAPSGKTYTGEMTYYTPGLGSCGITSSESEDVVALPVAMMTAANPPNPNDNPYCGKMITISYGGKTATAKVVDTCPGCAGDSIDLSPPVFAELANMSEGRVAGVKWWFS